MTGAHNEKIIERAFQNVVTLLHIRNFSINPSRTPATRKEIEEYLIQTAYQKIGLTKDDSGRWVKL